MTKQQRLRNVAEGFLAGLVAAGFDGPFRYSHLDWELPFYRAWRAWAPASRPGADFPKFEVGGSADGRTCQVRETLWQVKRTSPFSEYRSQPLTAAPMGLPPEEYLEIWVKEATPQEWVDLARCFLAHLSDSDRQS